ncbi:MAG: alkaline phosphatase [Phycisphaerales bacterium JB059]
MSEHATRIDRRGFLQLGALAGAGALAGCASTTPVGLAPAPRGGRRGRAMNVIFMVSDGMSSGTLTLAEMARRTREGRTTNWAELWSDPGARRSVCRTHSADSLVTDSAAAGSAWGCGAHVNNGSINVTPEGDHLLPLLVQARAQGKATGLVSTARITHATPASFIANVRDRAQEREIGDQLLERGVDVALGGGAKHFDLERLADRDDLTVVRDASQLRAAGRGGRLLGLFGESHMSYEPDRQGNEPSLREMTEAAITRLADAPGGFVLQVEGGRVDHAAHANDAVSLVHDQLAFDDAVGAAARFAQSRDDTLLIVTSDHGNANPGMTVYGADGAAGLERLVQGKHSFSWIESQLGAAGSARERLSVLPLLVFQATGVELSDADRAWLHRALVERERADGFSAVRGFGPMLGAVLANAFGVAFLSPNHTADHVEVTALGPGSERLGAFIDNTDLHRLVVESLDLAPGRVASGA